MGFPLAQKLRLPRKLSDFALNFFGEILIAEAVHVGNALAYQLECLGAVEQVESLFVRQALVFGNEPYDARVFTLEKCWVRLYGSKVYCLQKMEVGVKNVLRGDANL